MPVDLKPNATLIYETVDGVVYARYHGQPSESRWIIGGDPEAVSRAQGNLFSYSDYQDMMRIAETNIVMRTQLEKLLDLYYILRDEK